MTLPQSKQWTASETKAFVDEFELGPWRSGPLSGLTLCVAEGIDIEERATGCGNDAFVSGRPLAASNAICVDLLLSCGAQCLGQGKVTELAFSPLVQVSCTQPVNGYSPERQILGSSPGIASAVSCGLVNFGLGIDTGGSLLSSASSCGLFAWKASYGIVSGAGNLPVAASFDSPAVLCKSSAELKKVVEALLCATDLDRKNSRQILVVQDAVAALDKGAQAAFKKGVEQMVSKFGVEAKYVSLREIIPTVSTLDELADLFEQLLGLELWCNYGHWLDNNMPVVGEEAKQKLFAARHLDRSRLPELMAVRAKLTQELNLGSLQNSFLCLPTATPPAAKDATVKNADRAKLSKQASLLSCLGSLGGLGQLTLPLADIDGAPVGVSVLSARWQDHELLRFV